MSEIILLNATVDAPVYNDFTVALLGLGIVFLGLISIILICKLFSIVLGSLVKNDAAHAAAAVHTAQTADTELSDEERENYYLLSEAEYDAAFGYDDDDGYDECGFNPYLGCYDWDE